MDGLSFFKRVKNLKIPFIILTGYGSVEKAVKAIREGAFDFISKPVDPDYLFIMIEKALESTRILRENIILKEVYSSTIGKSQIIGNSKNIINEAEKIKQCGSNGHTSASSG